MLHRLNRTNYARQATRKSRNICQPAAVQLLGVSQTIVERRACDVIVLGDSSLAAACAYSLARRGKDVILLPDMVGFVSMQDAFHAC